MIVNRGLKNTFRLMPGFGVCVDQGIASLGALNKAAGGVAKTAVIVHELGEFGTGTAKLLAEQAAVDRHRGQGSDRPRQSDAQLRQYRAPHPLARARHHHDVELPERIHAAGAHALSAEGQVAGFFSILGGGFNYKFVKEMPDVSQYMMDVNHWFNPKSEKAQALKKRVEAGGALFTFEVYLGYSTVMLLADLLERAGSADKEKLTAAVASSTFKAELMPYGPTKFVNGQNEGARPAVMQSLKGDIEVIAPEEFASAKAVFPRPKFTEACSTRASSSPAC